MLKPLHVNLFSTGKKKFPIHDYSILKKKTISIQYNIKFERNENVFIHVNII